MMCVIDTGAEVNVMSEKSSQMLNLKPNSQRKKNCMAMAEQKLPTVGEVTVQANSHITNTAKEFAFKSFQGSADTLLSLQCIRRFEAC